MPFHLFRDEHDAGPFTDVGCRKFSVCKNMDIDVQGDLSECRRLVSIRRKAHHWTRRYQHSCASP